MRHKYRSLRLDAVQPDSTAITLLHRIGVKHRLRFLFAKQLNPKNKNASILDFDNPLEACVLSIESTSHWGLVVKIEAQVVPQGIKRGYYKLQFNSDFICDHLPDEMFEE